MDLEFLKNPVFTLGQTTFTVESFLILLGVIVAFVVFAKLLYQLVLRRVVAKMDSRRKGAIESVSNFVYYVLVSIGVLVILQINGVDLTTLTLLTSALGIGIGFGMQAITNNLISGVIILFERPIKVGDRIEVGDVSGDVHAISIRATTVVTNNNIAVIVPNSDFITRKVINWSFTDNHVRFEVKVGVSYKADPEVVRQALLEVAEAHDGVMKSLKADVMFDEFAESSMKFSLRVWTQNYVSRPGVLRSELNYMIYKKFKEKNIEIPFPQVDLHVLDMPSPNRVSSRPEVSH